MFAKVLNWLTGYVLRLLVANTTNNSYRDGEGCHATYRPTPTHVGPCSRGLWQLGATGQLEALQSLVASGLHFDIDLAFRSSAAHGHQHVVKYLIEHGADTHKLDDYPLRASAVHGHLEVVTCLVEHGANIHALDDYALRSSAAYGNLHVVKYLVEHGADIHALDDYALCASAQGSQAHADKHLANQVADIYEFGQNEHYAPCHSTSHTPLEMVKYLVEQGADIHALDDRALRASAACGHLEVVKYLVEQGCDIHAHHDYALRRSTANCHLEVVKYLIEHGADTHAVDMFGCDVLRTSVEYGHVEMVRFFLYEVCYGQTNDFEFKYVNFVKYSPIRCLFEEEYDRRKSIQSTLAEELPIHALHFHLHPESLRVYYTSQYFGRDFPDRRYWE